VKVIAFERISINPGGGFVEPFASDGLAFATYCGGPVKQKSKNTIGLDASIAFK